MAERPGPPLVDTTTRTGVDSTVSALASNAATEFGAKLRELIAALSTGGPGGIPDNSIAPTKLNFDPATQAELDALASVARTGSYADLSGRPTLYTNEQAQDAAALLFANGTHTGITFNYDDTNEKLNATVTATGGGGSAAPSTGRNPLTGRWHLSGYSGVDATGTADQTALLQSVVDAVNAAGGGVIQIDPGVYRLNGTVIWKNGVSLAGVHRSLVTLKGYQVDAAVIRAIPGDGPTVANPLRDCTFSGFKIDANAQTLSGSYTSAVKGIFIQHMRRVQFLDLWIDGTGASSIGVDFLYEACVVDNCLITNYGRLNTGNGPGSSGVGLGTASTTDIEAFTVTRCHVVGGAGSRFGIFVESQNEGGTNQFAQATFGGRITDNYIAGGQWGIGDAGSRNLLIAHNQVTATTVAGIVVNGGTFTQGRTGYNGEISDNQLWGNRVGIHLDYAKTNVISYSGHYTVRDNRVTGSTDNGILIELRTVTVSAVHVLSNEVNHSGKTGLLITYNGTSPTAVLDKSSVRDNLIYANGQTGTTGVNDGLRISVAVTDSDVVGNKVFDHQPTKTQRYGLVITTAVTGGRVKDNDVRGNLTGPVLLTGATFTGVQFASNPGVPTPAPTAVTVGASPWTYTAPDYPTSLFITGGTVTSVTQAGATVGSTGERVLPLEPGDSVVVTYSAAPTALTRARA